MKRRKIILAGLIGFVVGILAALALQPLVRPFLDFFGPPKVTVINVTGEDISKVTLHLGSASENIPFLKNGHGVTARISECFSETSVRVSWTDSAGAHEEDAGGYMEAYGSYHEKIVLTPDRKATAFYNMGNPDTR